MCAAIVFLYGSIRGTIPSDKIIEIIMLVLVFYFNRTDRINPNEKENGK
jgi:hypothetical protein